MIGEQCTLGFGGAYGEQRQAIRALQGALKDRLSGLQVDENSVCTAKTAAASILSSMEKLGIIDSWGIDTYFDSMSFKMHMKMPGSLGRFPRTTVEMEVSIVE